ncbi:MAG: AAA family ATPase [Deltaproteobacteria bacterium]|nr:AAA family ATPase [Deltaproteobacteria bacterium]
MPITSVRLNSFTVFSGAELTFSPGINVFIGKNGTGKSHLLKLLYGCHSIMRSRNLQGPSQAKVDVLVANKLAGLFRPDGGAVGRLVTRRRGSNSGTVAVDADGKRLVFDIGLKGNRVTVRSATWVPPSPAVFLPTREALAMFEGFIPAYQNRELSFDETYYDLCVMLSGAQLRGPRGEAAAALLRPMSKVLGGRVFLKGGRFYVSQPGSGQFEAHLLAEGLRKLASLAQLIANGSLAESGTLLWDEPEANLNPALVRGVIDVLVELATQGIQVFIATHDYLLLHRLSLIAEHRGSQPVPPMKFFALSATRGMVDVESGDTAADLSHNPVLDEFAAYHREELALLQREAAQP